MNETQPRSAPWMWEEFDPGLTFPPVTLAVSAEDERLWAAQRGPARSGLDDLGPDTSGPNGAELMPLLVPLMMRGFIAVSSPRLPGNIHVSQSLEFPGRAPRVGEPLDFGFRITDRSERRGRGWVTIGVTARAAPCGSLLMTGEMVMIWAGRRPAMGAAG